MTQIARPDLRKERLKRGLTLVQMCQRTGIGSGDLSEIERGTRQAFPGWRKKIAEALELSEETLFQEVVNDS